MRSSDVPLQLAFGRMTQLTSANRAGTGEEMQMDNAKQGYGFKMFKTVSYWVIGTVAAVPITKWVESELNFSFFTPAITALWGWLLSVGTWLGQPVPLQIWLFLVILLCAGIMGANGIWAVNDLKSFRKAAQEEQDRADEKARDAIAKLKVVSTELDAAQLALLDTRTNLKAIGLELDAAHAKIAELQTPALPLLTEAQDKVIAAIAAYDSEGKECLANEFPRRIGFTLLEADGAMDVLEARKLIDFQYYSGRRYVTLTAKGRAYVLHPDFKPPLSALSSPRNKADI